jgi:hypothetical protein
VQKRGGKENANRITSHPNQRRLENRGQENTSDLAVNLCVSTHRMAALAVERLEDHYEVLHVLGSGATGV